MHFDIYILSKVRFWSVVNNQFILEKGREEEEGWGQGEPGEGGGGGVSGGEEVGVFTIVVSSLGWSKPGKMYPGCLLPCCTVLIRKQTSPVWNVCCGGKWCLHHFHQEWDT